MESESDNFVFRSKDIPLRNSAYLAEMKRKGKLCDVTFRGKQSSISAHRVIVAVAIPYFKDVFVNETNETGENEIDAAELDYGALELLVDYAYSNEVTITTGNCHSLLLAAKFLRLDEVQYACVEFLTRNLKANNVLQIWIYATELKLDRLVQKCECYIAEHFTKICEMDDFLALAPFDVENITSKDDLNVESEEIVFRAIISWVKILPKERQVYLQKLLSNVGMVFLSPQYLEVVISSEELIQKSSECRNLIEEVRNCDRKAKLIRLSRNKLRQTTRKDLPRCGLYAACFNYRDCAINFYDVESDSWVTLSRRPVNKEIYNAIAMDGKIVVFADSEVLTFNLETEEWAVWESLFYCSGFKNTVVHEKTLYCGIGSSECERVFSVEYDKLKENWIWSREWTLNSGRTDAGLATLAGHIYITGGRIGDLICNSVKRCNLRTKECETTEPMLCRRWNHGSASLNGKLYVCGGIDNLEITRAEVYDPVHNRWTAISSMNYPRSNFSLVPYNRKLYAVAGERTQNVEMYDPNNDAWKTAPAIPSVAGHIADVPCLLGSLKTFVKCTFIDDR